MDCVKKTHEECDWPRNSELILSEIRRLNKVITDLESAIERERQVRGQQLEFLNHRITEFREQQIEDRTRNKVFYGALVFIASAVTAVMTRLLI